MKAGLLKRLVSAPYYAKAWFAVASASEREDWEEILRILSPFEEKGLANNESNHWMACACASLGRWDEAISRFEQVDGSLKNPESEARRLYNHSYSLARVERIDEAICILETAEMTNWPTSTSDKAMRLLEHLRGGSVGDCRVLH